MIRVVLFLLLLMPSLVTATDYFVRCQTGNDGNTGLSDGQAFRTIQQAMDTVDGNDSIFIHDNETCTSNSSTTTETSGNSSSTRIIIDAYGGNDGMWYWTHADLFNSGWTESATNVWWHSVTNASAIGMSVWQDGVMEAFWYEGTGNCPGDLNSDKEFCVNTGQGRVYIHSTSNPATRYTNPGVEVVHNFGSSQNNTLLDMSGGEDNYEIRNGYLEKAEQDAVLLRGNTNIRFVNVKMGHSCRGIGSNPASRSCLNGGQAVINWSPQSGAGIGDIEFTGGSSCHNSGRDCWHWGNDGTTNSVLMEDFEFNRVFHGSAIGLGGTSPVTTVTFRRGSVHGVCNGLAWSNSSGSQDSYVSNYIIEDVHFYDGTDSSDSRFYGPAGHCGANDGAAFNQNGSDTHTYNFTFTRILCEDFKTCIDIDTCGACNITVDVDQSTFLNNESAPIIADNIDSFEVSNSIFRNNGIGPSNVYRDATYFACEGSTCSLGGLTDSGTDRNIFDSAGSGSPLINNNGTTRTLAQWQSDSGDDDNSIVDNPEFVSVDTSSNSVSVVNPNLLSTSPARGFAAGGADAGAFPNPPVPSTCNVGDINATTLSIIFSVTESPLSAVDNTKINLRAGGVGQTENSSVINGTTEVRTTLNSAISAGAALRLDLSQGAVTDSQGLGLFGGQNTQQLDIVCTNTVAGGGAEPVIFNVTEDAFVIENPPSGNGSKAIAIVLNDSTGEFQTYLKFDLTSIEFTAIQSAILEIFVPFNSATVTIDVLAVSNDSWDEGTITWSNKPSLGAEVTDLSITTPGTKQFDITAFVQSEVSGDKVVSVALTTTETGNGINLDTKESIFSGPTLIVTEDTP